MPKTTGSLIAAGLAAAALALGGAARPARGAVLGPHAAACAGAGPAMLVRVEGLKTRTGLIRVQSYGGDPAHYFEKGTYLERVELRTPPGGPVDVCMPVPRPGTYAVSVRHDVSGDGRSELSDGGGMSGNPDISLMDVLFKRRPAPDAVATDVRGVKLVPVRLNYIHGTSVGPVPGVER